MGDKMLTIYIDIYHQTLFFGRPGPNDHAIVYVTISTFPKNSMIACLNKISNLQVSHVNIFFESYGFQNGHVFIYFSFCLYVVDR